MAYNLPLTGNYKQVINLKYTINNSLIIHAHTQQAKTHVLSEMEKMKVQFHTHDEARATVKRTMKGLPHQSPTQKLKKTLKKKASPQSRSGNSSELTSKKATESRSQSLYGYCL